MKTSILYRKILYSADEAFSYNRHIPFTLPLHYHDDYELIYIASGSGKEYIRDGLSEYKAGNIDRGKYKISHNSDALFAL